MTNLTFEDIFHVYQTQEYIQQHIQSHEFSIKSPKEMKRKMVVISNLMSPWVGASQSAFASSIMQIHPFKLNDEYLHSLA